METVGPALRRRALRGLVVCGAVLGAAASSAAASTSVTLPSADTMTVIGGPGEGVVIKHADNGPVGYVEVSTTGTIASPLPTGCSHFRYDTSTNDPKTVTCPDLPINVLNLSTDSAPSLTVDDTECFDTMNVNLGQSAESFNVAPCPTGTMNLTTGAGNDLVTVLAPAQGHVANMTVVADLGAGDDHLYGDPAYTGALDVHGGVGADRLIGGGGDDHLYGDGDNDELEGGLGNDTLDGGSGDDLFDADGQDTVYAGDPGADIYVGGPGNDTLDLTGHVAGVNVSLDDSANDGSPGEGDDVGSDIETIIGTTGDDTITGSSHADVLDGGAGNDTIHGGDGDDTVLGRTGNDAVYGDGGNDDVEGGAGNDTVDGGSGRDTLFGDDQSCSLYVYCATGNDVIAARDGEADSVTCGLGADRAVVDAIDVVATDAISGCESIDRPTAAAGPTPTVPGATTTPTPFTATVTGKPSPSKGAGVNVACTSACSITATLGVSKSTAKTYKLGSKATTIGSTKATLLTAGSKKLTITLSKAAKKKLAKIKKLKVTLTVSVKDASGKITSTTQTITLTK